MQVGKLNSLFWLIVLLCNVQNVLAQKVKKSPLSTDTIPLIAPKISTTVNCEFGINAILLEFENIDSALYTTKTFLYKINETSPLDSTVDTLRFIKSYTFKELENKSFKIIPEKDGEYVVRIEDKKEIKKLSPYSNKVAVNYCSAIEFDTYFDKAATQNFTPKKLLNIQIIEFSIFDRIGTTVYLHNNNTISWQGNYTNGQQCPNGIYYYHCEYIDIADDSKKKAKSGMIELKSNN